MVNDVLNRLIAGGLAEDVGVEGGKGRRGRRVRQSRWKPWADIQQQSGKDALRSRLALGEEDFACGPSPG